MVHPVVVTTGRPERIFVQQPRVLRRTTLDGILLLAPEGTNPQALLGTASELWAAFEEPTDLDTALRAVAERFGTPEDIVREAMTPIFDELVAHALLVDATSTGTRR